MAMCIHSQEFETCSFGCTFRKKEELKLENDQLQAALDKRRWIPVSERLPENTDDILLMYPCAEIFMGYYNGRWNPYQETVCNDQIVTHWKPIHLPEKE